MVGPPAIPDWDQVRKTVLPKIRLESNEGRWEFGGWLPDDHRRYFRDLIQFEYRQWVRLKSRNRLSMAEPIPH